MNYKIFHHKLFEKEILKVPSHHQQKIYRLLTALKGVPDQLPSNTTQLSGYKNIYRTRLGNLSLIYQINHPQKNIFVLGIGFRGNVYKVLNRMLR